MTTNLFGAEFDLDEMSIERIQQYFDKYIKQNTEYTDEEVLEMVSLITRTPVCDLYTEYELNAMFLMKCAMLTSKESSIALNSLLTDDERYELFMDKESLLYSRIFTHHFTLDRIPGDKFTLTHDDLKFNDYVIRFVTSCIISTNETQLLDETEIDELNAIIRSRMTLLDLMTGIDELLASFKVTQIDASALDPVLYTWMDDKSNFDDIPKLFRIFVPIENETTDNVKTPTMLMSDILIDAFISNHPDISVNYLMNAIIIQNLLNFEVLAVKANSLDLDFDELVEEGFGLITEHLNMFTDAITLRDEEFDISRLGISPYYICYLFKKFYSEHKTGLKVIDYSETGIYDLLTFVINTRAYVEFLEVINNYIDVAGAINNGLAKIIDVSVVAYLSIELRLPIYGKIDFAITNDPELHVFRFNDSIKFGNELMSVETFMSQGIVTDIENGYINGALFNTHMYSEDIRDAISLLRFIQRNK